MAVSISSTGYYNLTADTLLDIPSGDFSWCFWFRSTKADANAHMILDQYDATNNDGIRFFLTPTEQLRFSFQIGANFNNIITVATLVGGVKYFVVGQRDGSNIRLKYATIGDTSVTIVSASGASTAAQAVTDDLHILSDQDLVSSQFAVDEDIGEIGKVHRAITDEEILAIANGSGLLPILGNDLVVYIPATEHSSGGLSDLVGGLTATVVSSSHATAEHFPLALNTISHIPFIAAVSAASLLLMQQSFRQ